MNKLQFNACAFRGAIKTVLVTLLCLLALNGKTQVPILNSYPPASAVLFLDFDGHTVDNTPWNYNGPIYCGPAGLNSTQITEVFNRVSEDYRPFNINITTDSLKYLAAQPDRRMRVVLTITSDWYGPAGGVAFNGSFTWGDGSPCFVFTALLNNNVKNISEAASHEAGHTLGLQHQSVYDNNCVKVSDYNYGNGSGEIGWAPIMGVGYYRNLTLWHNGPNPYGCNNYQSDLDIIISNNGFNYRPDDHGNSAGSATLISIAGNQFNFSGVIERNTDADFLKVNMPLKGRFELNAVPYNVGTGNSGSDLDLQVSLFTGSGQFLRVYNPDNLLSSIIDSVLDAGSYYIKVEGRGNAYAPDYAILGSYSLQGRITAGLLPLRRLELKGRIDNNKHQLNWIVEADEPVSGQTLEYSSDGVNFNLLQQLAADDRQFAYAPFLNTAVFYRLRVRLNNGEQYITNVIAIRPISDAAPHLLGNIVNNGVLLLQAPGICRYTIYDISGRVMSGGELPQGNSSLKVSGYSAGLYYAEFVLGGVKYTERFIIK